MKELRKPYHDFEKRLFAAAQMAKTDPTEYGVEMFLAGMEYVAFAEGSPLIGDPKLASRIRGLIAQSRESGINGRNAVGHARYWAKSIVNPMSDRQWKESGMLHGFNEHQRRIAMDLYDDIHTSHPKETFIWNCIIIANMILNRIWFSEYDNLYPSMKDRSVLETSISVNQIMRKVDEQIEKGGRLIFNHKDIAHECVKAMIDTDHLLLHGKNGSTPFKEAMATFLKISDKLHKAGRDGWQLCDARDVLFLAAHEGYEPTLVDDGFSGGVIMHYERGDRAVDVMFDPRDRKNPNKTLVSLCEAEGKDTPFIPLSTIDATSHEQVVGLMKSHLA